MAESMTPVKTLPARRDVRIGDTWDLESLFSSDHEWEAALQAWERRIPGFAAFAGTLGSSPERLAECLAYDLAVDRVVFVEQAAKMHARRFEGVDRVAVVGEFGGQRVVEVKGFAHGMEWLVSR